MKANNRVDGMEIRFDRIDTRLDGMDARFDGIDEALNWQGEMLKVHGASLGAIETTQSEHTAMLQQILARLDAPRP